MTAAVTSASAAPLQPIVTALGGAAGVAPGLVVPNPTGWLPASSFVDGTALPTLLDAPRRLWGAAPHAAAALAWKQYTFWVMLPAVIGYAAVRRVPRLDADNVVLRLANESPYVTVGMRHAAVAVLPTDPAAGLPGVQVVPDEVALLATLRESLVDGHLKPLADATRSQVRVGERVLWGAVAASVGYVLTTASLKPVGDLDTITATAATLLDALGLADLAEVCPDGISGTCIVRRQTCCLAFTVPGMGLCSGCCVPATAAAPTPS